MFEPKMTPHSNPRILNALHAQQSRLCDVLTSSPLGELKTAGSQYRHICMKNNAILRYIKCCDVSSTHTVGWMSASNNGHCPI
jgi:hypothetical protein